MEMEHSDVESATEDEMIRLRCLHDEGFLSISQGLNYEDQNLSTAALQKYLEGEQRLREALNVHVPDGERYIAFRNMKAKMYKHLEELSGRIAALRVEGPRNEAPPPYEMNGNINHSEEMKKLSSVASAPPSRQTSEQRPRSLMSEELFSITEGVQLFQVSVDGHVSSPQLPTSLHIMCFIPSATCTPTEATTPTDNNSSLEAAVSPPPAWLEVGDWVFPLVPGQSVVLKTGYGAYMFPDIGRDPQPGAASVGLILPSEMTLEDRDNFEHLLVELTLFTSEDRRAPPDAQIRTPMTDGRMSHKISDAIVTGAGYMGTALSKGTEWTGYWVQRGAGALRERLNPDDRPTRVDPRVQTGLKVLRGASGAARKCSGYLVGKLSDLTCTLAKQAAPHLRYHGNRFLASSGLLGVDAVDAANNNKPTVVDDIFVVAAGGVQGFSVLYMSLETAARQLASCLASETVQVVHHKYGSEASEVVDNAVSSLGNLALATNNIRSFGVKAIAKRTAKDTGKAVLHDYVEKHPEPKPGT